MEDRVTSDYGNTECNGEDIENEMEKASAEVIEDNIDNQTDEIRNAEEHLEDPKPGMVFDSVDEVMKFYTRYAKEKGFAVCKRTSSKGNDGEMRYATITCNRSGKQKIRSSNLVKLQPQLKTNCKARVTANLCTSGKWRLNFVNLDHNHGLSPGKTRFFKCNRILQPHVKRRLELNDIAGIKMNQNFNSFVVEGGGHEKLTFLEKDARNYLNGIRRLQLKGGDAIAMQNYFLKMQSDNSNFFSMIDLNEEGRLRNVFWADARSRAAWREFGDVVTFDMTYLVNKYDMPFAPFVGVNHHGQSILLGCGLISSEDTESFTWLFQSWLTCMFESPPSAIITDQDRAMQKAIAKVFPNARHRWCLWHIMKKVPEKLRKYKKYEPIKFEMQNVVYDSLTTEEFEKRWDRFIEMFELQSNEWLLGLYEERHRWVPAFVKDIFWAGMSTTQRSESMHAFFDGYINSKTTLKQLVEQYENALAKKVENENLEEFNSFSSCIPCISHYEIEKQFQSAYTRAKFKESQREILGKIYCDLTTCKEDGGISEYTIDEYVKVGESHQRATFIVVFKDDTKEVNCNCRLFEFGGILCKHQITVFMHRKIDQVPEKYILRRWDKNVKRNHMKVRISYANCFTKPEAHRFNKICNAFYEVADLRAETDDKCDKMIERIQQLKWEFTEVGDVYGSNKPRSTSIHNGFPSCGDGIIIPKENRAILDPLALRQKGRPPLKRKQSIVEKAVKKKKERNKKQKTTTCNEGNVVKDFEETENVHVTTSTTGFGVTRTQEGFILDETEMQRSQYIGGESYAFNRGSLMWPNMSAYPNFSGIHPYYGHPNMLLGGRYPFQSSTGGQGFDTNSIFFNGSESQSNIHPPWRACYDLAPTSMPSPEEDKVEEGPKI
ncbi:hypothetical protein ACSBR1_022531 [Camellia fascicularis]